MLNYFRGARPAPPKALGHGRLAVERRHQWRRGLKMAPGVNPRNPLSRPALRGGVICGGGEKAPPLYPAPKSSPVAPASQRFQRSPVLPQTRLTGRGRAALEAGWGRDATQPGKAAQTASQGQTAGKRTGRSSRPSRCFVTSPFPAHEFPSVLRRMRPLPAPLSPAAGTGTGSRLSSSRSPLSPAACW